MIWPYIIKSIDQDRDQLINWMLISRPVIDFLGVLGMAMGVFLVKRNYNVRINFVFGGFLVFLSIYPSIQHFKDPFTFF